MPALLDGVDALLPSPLDVPSPDLFFKSADKLISISYQAALAGNKTKTSKGKGKKEKPLYPALTRYLQHNPLVMYAFKLQHSSQGMLVFARLYAGARGPKPPCSTHAHTRWRRCCGRFA